jgi:dolichol-phosphate mannosyltransferase
MTFTVVAPAYNEEAVIARFVQDVYGALGDAAELLVVDDGSTDQTPGLLADLAASHDRLRVVTHTTNRGLGAALATRFAAAAEEVVVTIDADLSHPRELIPVLVASCETADAAFASRFVPGGTMDDVPRLRAWMSRAGNAVLRLLLRVSVRDMTTGFRAYRKASVDGLPLKGTGFETQLEITVRMVHHEARIVEVPLALRSRAAGESKMRYLSLLPAYGAMTLRMIGLRWFGIGA